MDSSFLRCAVLGLLWLSLLLPLRGWACAMTQLDATAGAASMADTAAPARSQEMTEAPCHAAVVASAAADGNADASQPSTHPCASCDLCHSAGLPASPSATTAGFVPPQIARAQPQRDSFAAAVARPPPRA